MKAKLFIFLAVFTLSVSFHSVSIAETIYMKDGRVIKEKIVERGQYHIITEKNNFPRKYSTGQIDRIEEDQPEKRAREITNIDLTQFEGIPEGKVSLIVTLLEVSGVRRNMGQNLEQVALQVPEEQREGYQELFNVNEIIERLIPVYDKFYSEEDLTEIVRFYESPAGQKMMEVTPEIMKESVGVSIEYFQEKTAP